MTNAIIHQLMQFVANHQQFVEGALLGAILSNPGTCAVLLFNLALKIPGFGPWVAKNPDKAKAWFDGFDKAIDSQVDKYAAQPQAPKP